MRDRWTRRAVLGAVAAAGAGGTLAGCGWWDEDDPAAPPPDPLEPLLAATRALIEQYDRVLAAHPDLAGQLDPVREAHRAHETALLAMIGRPELATPSPGGTTPSPGSAIWSPPTPDGTVPEQPDEALAQLRAAEQQGQDEAAAACLPAPPERAAQLGSITAARASHAEVLA